MTSDPAASPVQPTHSTPELLAPAGNWDCVAAAVENGADAIYFGLDCGFNARYRAANFGLADLDALMAKLHGRGVRGYTTINTLVFPSEMDALVDVIAAIAAAGVDAVLVQDLGVAELVREICPEIEIHASTQMSLTSAETIAAVAQRLDLARVVLARELSIDEIAKITAATEVPVEVFIHGALCVAYSGQCLTSESLGGRSANRGQCAQACRLPYELVADGVDRDLGDVQYLLSPQDLAGYPAVPALVAAGVASLKIEGRLKTPEYVAGMTAKYRGAIDAAVAGLASPIDDVARREMELSFSRGFTPGWLEGNDHKRLVPGITSAKQGITLGTVQSVDGHHIAVRTDVPVARGDGIAVATDPMTGSRVYDVRTDRRGMTWLDLGRSFDGGAITEGMAVYKNDDPALNRRLRQSYDRKDPQRRLPIDVSVRAVAGEPLSMTAEVILSNRTITASVVGDEPLPVARNRPADAAMLRDKIGSLGGTAFVLREFDAEINGQPMVPLGQIKRLRRELIETTRQRLSAPPVRRVDAAAGRRLIRRTVGDADVGRGSSAAFGPSLSVLCRTPDQVIALSRSDLAIDGLMVDFHDVRQYRDAVAVARQAGIPIAIASVRIQKPGEMGLLKVLPRTEPDAVLCRNLAAIEFAKQRSIRAIADFSLNVTNHLSAAMLRRMGVDRITASYDLNADQLTDLVGSMPPNFIEVVLHQHMPMFHMEHCVFCSVMSPGTNKTNCGRPCDDHRVELRDRVGALHVLQADVACRNTLYNERPQSGAEIAGDLIQSGVSHFRVELLEENATRSVQTVGLYRRLIDGQIDAPDLLAAVGAINRVGVTAGTLEARRNPLAIL